MRNRLVGLAAFVCILAWSITASAQNAQITGSVKDSSGGVIPGATITARNAETGLTRVAVTDNSGDFRLPSLTPGRYSVSTELSGFSSETRPDIILIIDQTAIIHFVLKPAAVSETVTVTGESPIVDIQSTTHERVLGRDAIEAIPTSNTHFSVATLIPAVQSSNTADVGGTNAISLVALTAHGGRNTDMRVLLDGLSTNNTEGGGQFSGYLPNMGSTQEVSVDFAAGLAEQGTGGVFLHVVPRDGGNKFSFSFFATGATEGMEADNLTQDLKDRKFTTTTNYKEIWDVSGGVGGPIMKDKLWFYTAHRWWGHDNYVPGLYENATPQAWTRSCSSASAPACWCRALDLWSRTGL
jgi:hypothetical protein